MNKVVAYLTDAMQGMSQCFEADKTVVILLSALLILWLKDKKTVDDKGNKFLVYTLIMAAVLLCPITAGALMMYQTRFYDYEWAWSMVPMIAIIAYAGVLLYEEKIAVLSKWKKIAAICLTIVGLALCGNQGALQTVQAQESRARNCASDIVECIEQHSTMAKVTLWGPKNIMQEVRRQTGEILLVYGKDMWDGKSGAYDYEAYDEKMMQAYDWMEIVDQLVRDSADIALMDEEYKLAKKAEIYLPIIMEAGVNAIVLPKPADEFFSGKIETLAKEHALTVESVSTQQHTVYLLK